jgi:hypothetical protein
MLHYLWTGLWQCIIIVKNYIFVTCFCKMYVIRY